MEITVTLVSLKAFPQTPSRGTERIELRVQR
jgi:hypothetical protein